MKWAGIDLGGTFIKCGIVNEEYQILCQDSVPTGRERDSMEVIKDMAALVVATAKKAGVDVSELVGVGIGSPGISDTSTGEILYSNNIAWEHVQLGKQLGELLKLPVKVSNDANCAALGELVCDTSAVYKNAVMITLGTGVGSGIIIDGRLYEGATIGGTELGHMVICHGGRPCNCGRTGCLETYVSTSALIRDVKDCVMKYGSSCLQELAQTDALNGKEIIAAVRQGDSAAKEAFDGYLESLACGITNIINIFRPEVVYLGGGICEGFDLMGNYLNAYVQEHCFGGRTAQVAEIKKATQGNAAGIIGAAALFR